MAEYRTLARPYAKAYFELAAADQQTQAAQSDLNQLATLVSHADFAKLLGNPNVSHAQIQGIITAAVGSFQSDKTQNLLALLMQNNRLKVIPALLTVFNELKAEAERFVEVEVTSATPLSAEQQVQFASSLSLKLNRRINIKTAVDEDLLGGAVIRAGDLVIDGSVRGDLARMAQQLSA